MPGPHPLLVGFHGYGENAAVHLQALQRAVAHRAWIVVSVQALHRFYTRGDREVVASWMTREDRDLAIADNVAYVEAVLADVERTHLVRRPLVFAGFSQGVAMAYRSAARLTPRADGLIVLAGDVPPDVAAHASALPRTLIGRGVEDEWYTALKCAADCELLGAAGIDVQTRVFGEGHVWSDAFAAAAGRFLDELHP